MVGHTMVDTGMERGQLTQNLHQMLMPRPNHGTDGDMVGHTMVDTGTERGLLTPNPHPMLMPMPNHGTMEDMDMDGLPTAKNLLCNQLNITEKIEATHGTKLKLLFLHPDESQFFGKVVLLPQRIESLTNKIVAYTI